MEVTPEHPELSRLLSRDRAETVRRFRIIIELNRLIAEGKPHGHHAAELVAAYSQMLRSSGLRMSVTSLYSWRRAYRLDGLRGLIDRRRLSKKRPVIASSFGEFLNLVRQGYRELEGSGVALRVIFEFAYFDACRKSDGKPWPVCGFREAFSFLAKEIQPSMSVQAGATSAKKARSNSLQSEFDRAS